VHRRGAREGTRLQLGEVGRSSMGQLGIDLGEASEGKGRLDGIRMKQRGAGEGMRGCSEGGRISYGWSWCQGEEMKYGRGSGEE